MNNLVDQRVYIVDDDEEFAESVSFLLISADIQVEVFLSAESFLDQTSAELSGCVLLDVRMPKMSGLELQTILAKDAPDLPIIIMTAHGDISMAVRAIKDGALDFIEKPFNGQLLIDLVNRAMRQNNILSEKRKCSSDRQDRLNMITSRENEVLSLIVEGKTTKEIAVELNIAGRTVEGHRAKIMKKTKTKSIQELLKLVLGITPAP